MNIFYLKTFGCKLNQYESQLIRESLIFNGWLEVENPEQADYVLINSCCVTYRAVKELKKFIRSIKRKNSNIKIAVLGCLIELYPQELQEFDCEILANNREKFDLLGRLVKTKSSIEGFKNHTRAFVKVQDGCNNRCTYCCVWMARGLSRSRDKKQILDEIKVLLNAGHREIVFTGCCLGDFGKDVNYSLPLLLEDIERIDHDFRLRLSSIEPQDVNKELIDVIANSKKVVPYLHIPLQSGSNRILKSMARKYDRDYFKKLVLGLKNINNFQFSTDIIIGFPGESERDFKDTLELLRKLKPIRVHMFPFSPRPKTVAYKLGNRVVDSTVVKRRTEAILVTRSLILENLKKQIGNKFQVLIEQKSKGLWIGYSENYIKIKIKDSRVLKNKLLLVKAIDLDLEDSSLLAVSLH